MGSYSSKDELVYENEEQEIEKYGMDERKAAIKNTPNPRDKDIPLPKEYKFTTKDICDQYRKNYKNKQDENIHIQIRRLCFIDGIKDQLMNGRNKNSEYIPIKFYLR